MKLTEQEQKLVLQKAGRAKCQICGSLDWWIQEAVVVALLPPSEQGSITMGAGNTPCIQMICKECGQISLLSTKILGIAE